MSSISAKKKYQNAFTCIKVISRRSWDVFLRHGVYSACMCWCDQVCSASSVLVLLNVDSRLLSHVQPSTRCAPAVTVSTLTLYMATLLDCVIFDPHGLLDWVFGLLELTALCCTLPVAACLSAMVWRQRSLRLDICVVFTAPLYVILLITGETYSAWSLASCGVAASYWLIRHKLKYDQCR